MKLLCIDHEGGFGGSSRSLYYLLKNIDNKKINKHVWIGKNGPIVSMYNDLDISNIVFKGFPVFNTVFRFTRNILGILYFIYKIITSIKSIIYMTRKINNEFDLVHFNHPNLFLLAVILRLFTNKPFTFHIRTSLEDLYEGNKTFKFTYNFNNYTSRLFAKLQVNIISKVSDSLIFISNFEKKSFINLGGTINGKVVPNIADSSKLDINNLCFKSEKRFKVAVIENYRWSRGTDRILDIALAFQKLNITNIVFIVAGDMTIPNHIGNKLFKSSGKNTSFSDYIAYKGISNYFIFLGHVSNPEKIIMSCDILTSLSRRGGPWGRSVIEALKLGKPVVSAGLNKGIVLNKKNGIHINKYNANVIAKKISYLSHNKKEYKKLSTGAKKHIEINYDSKKNANKIMFFWQNIIALR